MTSYQPIGRRYSARRPRQSTKALTMKLIALAVAATIVIGGLIATQMAAGNDPALGPKAAARAKKAAGKRTTNGSSASSGTGTQTDPYSQSYGDDGYYYGYGSSDGSGSSGSSSGSGSGGSTYSPPPVTSSTS